MYQTSKHSIRHLLLGVFAFSLAHPISAEHADELPEITVEKEKITIEQYVIDPQLINTPTSDTGQLLKRAPGASVNSNGNITGIAQYRGMYGDRVNVLLDGIKISPGGPNAMDTPISYIPRAQLEQLEVTRGISSVSAGNETIGGTIEAKSTHGQFTDSEQYSYSGAATAGYHTVDGGYNASALLAITNKNHRMHVAGSRDDSNDYEFPGGTVIPTEYERDNAEIGYGYRDESQELGLEYTRNDTGPSGTPALPMDIIVIDTNIASAKYDRTFGGMKLESKLYWSEVDHVMNNFQLRQAPLIVMGPMAGNRMRRQTVADSNDVGYSLTASRSLGVGTLSFGTDAHLAEHNADIFNPMNAAFLVENFSDIERDVFGFFGEWNGNISNSWNLEAGLRYTHIRMDAGTVSANGMMGMMAANSAILATRFNNADRSVDDNNIDAVLKLTHNINSNLDLELGLARKTRSASYQERFLWLPLQSSGGLADGNTYIGDINLDPEVSYQFELGLDMKTNKAYFGPRFFYHHVDDYIQGIAATDATALAFNTMANNMTNRGSALLQFANVDARLYGIDADFGYQLHPQWHVDGVVSYVKGERRDNNDNLYRIAPANMRLGLTHERTRWATTLELETYLQKPMSPQLIANWKPGVMPY